MLLIPYKDQHGRIRACQLRLHPLDIPKDNPKKYRWLASPNEPRGTSSGTPIHFAFNPNSLPPSSDVVITEGALKAETLVSLRPDVRAIATSGVNCSHVELVNAASPYSVLIGFDSDYKTNPAVCRQLAWLIASRELDRQSPQLTTTTRILSWNGHKGIDEAAYAKESIKIVSISQWLSQLSGQPLEEVSKMWSEVDYAPNKDSNGDSHDQTQTPSSTNPAPCDPMRIDRTALSDAQPGLRHHHDRYESRHSQRFRNQQQET